MGKGRLVNWAMKRGGTTFEVWRVWAGFKGLARLVWRIPLALAFNHGLRVLSRANDVWQADGLWHFYWQRDGLELSGSRVGVVYALARDQIHTNRWVIKSAWQRIRAKGEGKK